MRALAADRAVRGATSSSKVDAATLAFPITEARRLKSGRSADLLRLLIRQRALWRCACASSRCADGVIFGDLSA